MNYLAIIGDMIKSREIKNRKQEQERIEEVLSKINQQYQEIIVSRITLTLGDEFQALLRIDHRVMQMLDDLETQLELPYRLGIGFGQIRTKIRPEISIGADGEAFWHAREAIENIHENDWGGYAKVRFVGLGELRDQTINALFRTTDTIKQSWTTTRRETFAELLAQGIYSVTFDQKRFAESIGISQSSLSKRLSGGAIKIYLDARQTIGELLEAWCDTTVDS